jgi:glycosyltransferase involved in cell wall biosynthesis
MRIASITSGAAGMICGSCLKDNTLAAALSQLGHDAFLIPTYTPIRTDEPDVSRSPVFLGGINVYLQQMGRIFRHLPRPITRWLDRPRVLRWVGRFAGAVQADKLANLTLSMLKGVEGRQRREFVRLIDWLESDLKPDIVLLSNVLISGMIPEFKRRLGIPIVATLQGDDVFLDLFPPDLRERATELIRRNCEGVDGYLVTCRWYADYMASYLGLRRELMHVVYPGIRLGGYEVTNTTNAEPVIGYLARIAPEKGLHNLAEGFIRLRQMPGTPRCRLHIAGWLGSHQRSYLDGVMNRFAKHGLHDDVTLVNAESHAEKQRFLHGLDILSVPTAFLEPKGLYVLEALATGVPVVQPRHGAFPEIIEHTGGGLLVAPNDADDLARGLQRLVADGSLRRELGLRGASAVRERFSDVRMARDTIEVLGELLAPHRPATHD